MKLFFSCIYILRIKSRVFVWANSHVQLPPVLQRYIAQKFHLVELLVDSSWKLWTILAVPINACLASGLEQWYTMEPRCFLKKKLLERRQEICICSRRSIYHTKNKSEAHITEKWPEKCEKIRIDAKHPHIRCSTDGTGGSESIRCVASFFFPSHDMATGSRASKVKISAGVLWTIVTDDEKLLLPFLFDGKEAATSDQDQSTKNAQCF